MDSGRVPRTGDTSHGPRGVFAVARQALRTLLSGEPDGRTEYVERMRCAGDAGLFGPRSVTWKVMGSPSTLIGGVRALLLQALDPVSVAGFARHSRFKQDPIGRLQATARFVTVASFASTDDVRAECEKINGIHRRVKGTLPDGTVYAASDPLRLRLVHLTLVASFLAAHQRFSPSPLSVEESDRFVVEWNALAPLLGFDSVPLPGSFAELDDMLAVEAESWRIDEPSVDAFEFLARPPLPKGFRVGYRLLLRLAVASLPRSVKETLPGCVPSFSARFPRRVVDRLGRACVGVLTLMLGPSPALLAAETRLRLVQAPDGFTG